MSASNSIVDLYTRIPDYSEVKHLGNSDFINTVERLKEEFRKCRAILNEDSDVEYICTQTSKVLNISQNSSQNQGPNYSLDHQQQKKSTLKTGSSSRNVNIVSPKGSCSNNLYYLPATNNINNSSLNKATSPYLSVSSCALHKNPNDNILTGSNLRSGERVGSAYSSCIFRDQSESRNYDESAYAEDFELCSSGASTPESVLSRWSSSPEINLTTRGDKDYCPPTNIEKRLSIRRSQNNSAPSIPDIEPKSPRFKAHPVPAHVHKPLFDYIMLKNKKRSDRVREQSKQKLLAQVKPFSFSNDTRIPKCSSNHGQFFERSDDYMLNNSRPVKNRRNHHSNHTGIKTNNNKFNLNHQFKAHPAPPRTKALLAAIKLREQQEYRALKKRLRAEAMMKTASLPPSMAARDRRSKANLTRLDNLLSQFNVSDNKDSKNKRHLRESSTDTFTDEDRLTEDNEFYSGITARRHERNSRANGPNLTSRPMTSRMTTGRARHKSGNFTPYNEPKLTGSANLNEIWGSINDNHASKLRVQVAKAKELGNIQKEEEELLRAMKMDKKKQKLRDTHYQAWRRAGSYSSAQDIAMRRQLRMAAAILDRESYRKEMTSMLTRVRSAPLLLEGLRERKSEPCKKHKEGFGNNATTNKSLNKLSSPRYMGQQHYFNSKFNSKSNWSLNREHAEPEKSETAALAEGSLTNSDNESVKNPELEFDQLDQDFEEDTEQQQQSNDTTKQNNSYSRQNGNGEPAKNGQVYSSSNGINYNNHNNHVKINDQIVMKSPPLITVDTYTDNEEDEDEEEEEENEKGENDRGHDEDSNADSGQNYQEDDLNEEDIFENF